MDIWIRATLIAVLVVMGAGAVSADWHDSFSDGAFDLTTWEFLSYPQIPGVTQFKGAIVTGPGDQHYLALDEGLPASSGGAAFGMAFGSHEIFSDVRLGAVVNVTGDASQHYHGLGARANFVISDGTQTPAPGMIANAYIMHIDWDNGPANLGINIEKVFNNDHSDVHRREFEAVVPGLDNQRSFFAALDVVGSNPVYITGYLYEYPGGPLVAQTETMVDTDQQDSWEDPGPHIGVFEQGKSGVFGQNEQDDPPGFRVTFDDISSASAAAVALLPSPAPGAREVSMDPQLTWHEAAFSEGRRVWFGPVGQSVEVNPAPEKGRYDPGLLLPHTTYAWRVDQRVAQGIVRGNTWYFTTGSCLVVDTFERYASDDEIADAWPHNIPPNPDTGQTYHYVFLETDAASQGRQAMRLEIQNQFAPFVTEATLSWMSPQDWTVVTNPCLTLDFRGEAGNVEQHLVLRLEDADGNQASVEHPFTFAVQSETWRTWDPIALADFEGVDPHAVVKLTVRVGDGTDSGQAGEMIDTLYLDNIRISSAPEH
jgi:hypothetical protein